MLRSDRSSRTGRAAQHSTEGWRRQVSSPPESTYARWAGKKIPTYLHWEYAVRGEAAHPTATSGIALSSDDINLGYDLALTRDGVGARRLNAEIELDSRRLDVMDGYSVWVDGNLVAERAWIDATEIMCLRPRQRGQREEDPLAGAMTVPASFRAVAAIFLFTAAAFPYRASSSDGECRAYAARAQPVEPRTHATSGRSPWPLTTSGSGTY
ncbi:hypothetical protein Poly30_56220 [Planctomycetes bacterium Poly30]|uniref:Uncharacterized protein n=1 Tax=Saltatorellus ferox TaxID=2528018 RepID=A0A518F160_9BACT|nr:hypothetical protein Poly30_56220 [Planctomycetes bacterium Poly30]